MQVAAPEIAMIKVAAPNMALKVIDRAIQVSANIYKGYLSFSALKLCSSYGSQVHLSLILLQIIQIIKTLN